MRRKQFRLISTLLLLSLPIFVIYSRYRHIDDSLMVNTPILFIIYFFVKKNYDISFYLFNFKSEVEIRMTERKIRLSDTCQRYNIRLGASSAIFSAVHHPPAPQFSVFYFDPYKNYIDLSIVRRLKINVDEFITNCKGKGDGLIVQFIKLHRRPCCIGYFVSEVLRNRIQKSKSATSQDSTIRRLIILKLKRYLIVIILYVLF